MERNSIVLTLSHIAAAWAAVFAIVHFYWAAGGEIGMNGDPADTAGAQIYIAVIALLGLVGAALAYAATRPSRTRTLLVRAGGAALLLGVALGSGRWLADWSLNGDGASGVVTTAYFLLGGLLFSALGWRQPQRSLKQRSWRAAP
jgi:hypothetical protein